jgi:hypothetical protein
LWKHRLAVWTADVSPPGRSAEVEQVYALFPCWVLLGFSGAVAVGEQLHLGRGMAIGAGGAAAVLTVAWLVVGEVWERRVLRERVLFALRGEVLED